MNLRINISIYFFDRFVDWKFLVSIYFPINFNMSLERREKRKEIKRGEITVRTAVCLAAGKLCKLCGGSDRSFFLHYGKVSRSWHWTRIHVDIIPRVHLMFSLKCLAPVKERERERILSHFHCLMFRKPGIKTLTILPIE